MHSDRIAAGLGRAVARRPRPILFGLLLLFAWLASGVGSIELALSVEDLLMPNDPYREAYRSFREEFSSDESILFMVEGNDVFAADFLSRLVALHEDIEASLPHLVEVDSLVNARVTEGSRDQLVVRRFLEGWSAEHTTEAELRELRRTALENPSYRNVFVDERGRVAVLTATMAPGDGPLADQDLEAILEDAAFADTEEAEKQPRGALLDAASIDRAIPVAVAIRDRHDAAGFRVAFTGGPPMTFAMTRALERDMGVFTVASFVVIGAVLGLLFTRLSAVLVGLAIASVTIAATFGFMGHIGLPVTPATQILPSFLLAVGIAQAVHLLTPFFRALDTGASRAQAIELAFDESGTAVALATLTTVFGMGAFCAAELMPLVGLGVAASVGLVLTLLGALGLLPALLMVVPIRRRPPRPHGLRGRVDRLLASLGVQSIRRAPWVVGAWMAILLCALALLPSLEIVVDPMEWMRADHPFRRTADRVNETLGGGLPISILIDSGRAGGVASPDFLRALDRMHTEALDLEVGSASSSLAISVVAAVKETHRALEAGDPAAYTIPDERETVAQEMLLFESAGPDEIADLVDASFRLARLTLMVPLSDNRDYLRFVEALKLRAERVFLPGVRFEATGVPILGARSNELISLSMLRSYGISLILIGPMILWSIGSVRLGLLCMIPNLAPILVGLAAMQLFDIPLDIFTVLIASIAIGIAVDDTIHFTHGLKRELSRCDGGRLEAATRRTLETTGSALLTTSVTLALGFAVFALAEMRNVVHFGQVTAGIIIIAFVADVQLCPALLRLALGAEAEPKARSDDPEPPESVRRLSLASADHQTQRGAAPSTVPSIAERRGLARIGRRRSRPVIDPLDGDRRH